MEGSIVRGHDRRRRTVRQPISAYVSQCGGSGYGVQACARNVGAWITDGQKVKDGSFTQCTHSSGHETLLSESEGVGQAGEREDEGYQLGRSVPRMHDARG